MAIRMNLKGLALGFALCFAALTSHAQVQQGAGATPYPPGSVLCAPSTNTGAQTAVGCASSTVSTNLNILPCNVLNYGAFNDYASHLLSTLFGTLAAAQVVYPAATALAQEANVAAFQECANLTNATWGGAIYVPKGGYVLNGSVNLNNPHIHLYGDGQTESQLITNSTSFNVIQLGSSYYEINDIWINQYGAPINGQYWAIYDNTGSAGAYDVDIHDVEIAGGHSGIYAGGGRTIFLRTKITQIAPSAGVGIEFVNYTEIHDILEPYMENSGTKALTFTASVPSTSTSATLAAAFANPTGVYTVVFSDAETRQVTLTANATTATWSGGLSNTVTSAATYNGNAYAGIYITNGADFLIAGAQLQKMGSPLIVRPATNISISSIKTSHSYFDTSSGPEQLFDASASGSSIVNITQDSPWVASGSIGIQMLGAVEGMTISNIECVGNTNAGIDSTGATYITGFTLNGGKISGNGGAGVSIGANQSNWTIAGVTIGPSGQFGANGSGILIASGTSDYFNIVGNNLYGNTGAAFTNNASGDHVVVSQNNDGEVIGANGAFLGPFGQSNTLFCNQCGVLSGYGNNVQANGGVSWGNQNEADGAWSTAHGELSRAWGRVAVDCYSGTWFGAGTLGSAQRCEQILNNSATGATAVRLTADGTGTPVVSGGSANCVNLQNNTAYGLTINVTAFDKTTVTKSASWNGITGLIVRGANAAATALNIASNTPAASYTNGTLTGQSLSITADTTNGCLNISYTPPTSNTDTWHIVAYVQTVETY